MFPWWSGPRLSSPSFLRWWTCALTYSDAGEKKKKKRSQLPAFHKTPELFRTNQLHLNSIIPPPPCFTMALVFSWWLCKLFRFQTYLLEFKHISVLDTSNQRTSFCKGTVTPTFCRDRPAGGKLSCRPQHGSPGLSGDLWPDSGDCSERGCFGSNA